MNFLKTFLETAPWYFGQLWWCKGRLKRTPFWILTFLIIGGYLFLGFLGMVETNAAALNLTFLSPLIAFFHILLNDLPFIGVSSLSPFILYWQIMLGIKRLRDVGRSAWWMLPLPLFLLLFVFFLFLGLIWAPPAFLGGMKFLEALFFGAGGGFLITLCLINYWWLQPSKPSKKEEAGL